METPYEKYLALPKGAKPRLDQEMYVNHWYITTGRAIIAPHPHRHFTEEEFNERIKYDNKLYDRFMTK